MSAPGVPTLPDRRWYASTGRLRHQVVEQARQPDGGAGLEMAVVVAVAQRIEVSVDHRRQAAGDRDEHLVAVRAGGHRPLDRLARFAQRPRRRVDRQRCFVPEDVADHRRQDEPECGVDVRDVDRRRRRVPRVALVGHHDRGRLVGTEDRGLLGDVVGGATAQTRGTHEDQRLRRQIDVLLVLGGVACDRLVTELAELDPDLLGGDPVGSVADDRPVSLRRGEPSRRVGDRVAPGDDVEHRIGDRAQGVEQCVTSLGAAEPGGFGDRAGEQRTGRDLGVERLGRRHTHLDVASVRRVQDAVGLVDEIAPATVDDAEHGGASTTQEVDRPVRVGGGTALADGDREGVAHVETHAEPRQLGGRDGVDVETAVAELFEDRRRALAGDSRRALPDDADSRDGAGGQAGPRSTRERAGSDVGVQDTIALDDLAAQRLAEALGRLADLLPEEVRGVASVDVACRELGRDELLGSDRQLRAVVSEPADTGEIPAVGSVENDDLAALLTVEAEILTRLLDQAVRLTGDDVAVVGEPDAQALAAAAKREQQRVGSAGTRGPDGDRAVERRDRASERLDQRVARRARGARPAPGSPWRRW